MLQRARGGLGEHAGEIRAVPLGHDQRVDPEGAGRAQNRADIVRVGDLVERENDRRSSPLCPRYPPPAGGGPPAAGPDAPPPRRDGGSGRGRRPDAAPSPAAAQDRRCGAGRFPWRRASAACVGRRSAPRGQNARRRGSRPPATGGRKGSARRVASAAAGALRGSSRGRGAAGPLAAGGGSSQRRRLHPPFGVLPANRPRGLCGGRGVAKMAKQVAPEPDMRASRQPRAARRTASTSTMTGA